MNTQFTRVQTLRRGIHIPARTLGPGMPIHPHAVVHPRSRFNSDHPKPSHMQPKGGVVGHGRSSPAVPHDSKHLRGRCGGGCGHTGHTAGADTTAGGGTSSPSGGPVEAAPANYLAPLETIRYRPNSGMAIPAGFAKSPSTFAIYPIGGGALSSTRAGAAPGPAQDVSYGLNAHAPTETDAESLGYADPAYLQPGTTAPDQAPLPDRVGPAAPKGVIGTTKGFTGMEMLIAAVAAVVVYKAVIA